MNPNRVFAPPALSDVLVEIHDSIATVTLNRPEQRNPLSASITRDLKAALEWCRHEAGVAVVVLNGGLFDQTRSPVGSGTAALRRPSTATRTSIALLRALG